MPRLRVALVGLALAALLAFPVCAQEEEEPTLGPDPGAQLSHQWFSWRDAGAGWSSLYAALRDEDLVEAERLVKEGAALDDELATAAHFAYGTPAVRAFIRLHGPERISRGDVSLLSILLSEGVTTASADGSREGYYPFPTATTYLDDAKEPRRYAPEKAFDGRMGTAWVEGREGSGIGQKIAFPVPKEAVAIGIVPGFADDRWFSSNYRLKRAELLIYELTVTPALGGYLLALDPEPLATVELRLGDRMELQRFPLPRIQVEGYLVATLEILDVYPTGKWEDTCISEIRLFDSSGAPALDP